jgi:hypothetical protein
MDAGTQGEGTAEDIIGDMDESLEKDGIAPLSLEEIQACDIVELAKDKIKSRQLQRSLSRGGSAFSEVIFTKVEPHIMQLVRDQHGNYLLQKLIEVITAEQFDNIFNLLKEHLISLAKDTHGTRAVQKIVEVSVARNRVDEMLEALPGEQIENLARNITGFHVIVKLLDSLPTAKANELLDRLCGESSKVLAMGKDQWGCCVLKKCLDRSDGEVRDRLVDAVREHTLELVMDAFGNYVAQHLIINRPSAAAAGGKPAPVTLIIDAMKGKMFELSQHKFSSNVLEKCLQNSSDKDRNKIINEILNPPNQRPSESIRVLLFHQFGNYVFQQSLEVAKDPQFTLLVEHAKPLIQSIIRQTYSEVPGNLSAEHTHRLALKLAKKYPQLSEGLDMGMDPNWMQFPYDKMGYGYGCGFDGYGADFPNFGFDPYQAFDPFGGFGSFPPGINMPFMQDGGGGKGNQTRKKDGKGGQKGKQGGAGQKAGGKGASAGSKQGGQETVKVGRVVGFWPNYTIAYDDVPVAGGGRKPAKNKAKSKASPKPKPSRSAEAVDVHDEKQHIPSS